MPHCFLEYSSNIIDEIHFNDLLHKINNLLFSTGIFNLNDIKSRAVKHDLYVIGDGDSNRAFIALTISILSGRSDEIKEKITESALQLLKDSFCDTLKEKKCSIAVQVIDIHRKSYRKLVSGEQ